MKEIKIYSCDYCETYGLKEEMGLHEKNCFYNPEKKQCETCKSRYIPIASRESCRLHNDFIHTRNIIKPKKCGQWENK